MVPTQDPTLPVLALGLLIGLSTLVLVANELGKRTQLSFPARLLLTGGLGLGVLSVGIKVMIMSVLAQVDGQALASTGAAARETLQEWLPKAEVMPQVHDISTQASGYRTWRPLPITPPAPRENRTTAEKVALGRMLFHDATLSADRKLSCASCHDLADGGDDNARYSRGHRGQMGDRNAPTVLNAAFLKRLFWDGRAASLERQAEGPFTNPVEMAMPSMDAVAARVRENPSYSKLFSLAFPEDDSISGRNIIRAIAAYERTLVTPDTPYDRFIRGDDSALSPAALRGMALFDAVGCRSCHVDPMFSAAGTEKPMGVYRRFPVHVRENPYLEDYDLLVDGRPARYRVPSLRNVALTAPYFHNGSVDDLEEAIRIMAVSQLGRAISNDPVADMRVASRAVVGDQPGRNVVLFDNRSLSDREVSDIAAFLRSLTASTLPR